MGIVSVHKIVDTKTHAEANSPSFPYFTAIIAPLDAHGIANTKNNVYCTDFEIGKNATIAIVNTGINTSLIALAKNMYPFLKIYFKSISASFMPIINMDNGVIISDI